jgi:hypothetical protein
VGQYTQEGVGYAPRNPSGPASTPRSRAARIVNNSVKLLSGWEIAHHLDASLAQNRRYVRVEDLRPGMRLAADLMTSSGAVLLRQNELLGAEEVRRIERHHAIDPFWFSIAVYPAGAL